MDLFYIKIVATSLIFLVALICGLIPILLKENGFTKHLLFFGEIFSCGVFLGAGLIHMLPTAEKSFSSALAYSYPYPFVICAFTILLLSFIEQGVTSFFTHHQRSTTPTWMPYLLSILLSIHSLLAGSALGIQNNISSFLVIFVAIIAHKGAEAFALGINMYQHNLRKPIITKLILLFSLMTPVGVLLGSSLLHFLNTNSGYVFAGIFNSIAAGTFIYIATFNHERIEEQEIEMPKILHIGYFSLGIILMAVIAVWL